MPVNDAKLNQRVRNKMISMIQTGHTDKPGHTGETCKNCFCCSKRREFDYRHYKNIMYVRLQLQKN